MVVKAFEDKDSDAAASLGHVITRPVRIELRCNASLMISGSWRRMQLREKKKKKKKKKKKTRPHIYRESRLIRRAAAS